MRARDRALEQTAERLRVPPERVPESVRRAHGARPRARTRRPPRARQATARWTWTAGRPRGGHGGRERARGRRGGGATPRRCCRWSTGSRAQLGDAAIVLGSAGEERVDLVASVAPALVERGVRAGEIVKVAAQQVGGGGGGRDTLARAGGRDPERLPDGDQRGARSDRSGARRVADAGPRARLRQRTVRVRRQRSDRACWPPRWSRCQRRVATRAGPAAARWRPSSRWRRSWSDCRCRYREATPRRPERRGRSRPRSGAPCRCRWSSTTSASRPGWPSASAGAPSEDSRAAAHLLEGWLARREGAGVAGG